MAFPDLMEEQLTVSSSRYASADAFEQGYDDRMLNVKECFTFDKPFAGHGIMAWAYMRFGKDVYMYPHNSVAQVYYELGLIGMVLFLTIIYKSYKLGYVNFKRYSHTQNDKQMALALLAYLSFSFFLSLKQGTFLSCTGVYISFGCISVLYTNNKRASRKKQEKQHPKVIQQNTFS